MTTAIVVGSGASSVHCAKTLLGAGIDVTMLDVGYRPDAPVAAGKSFGDLKDTLRDPVSYYLGDKGDSVVLPRPDSRFYAFPPSKSYVFRWPNQFDAECSNFAPLISFAAGGLAEAWTGGVYPFNDGELAAFPIAFEDLRPFYAEVIRRIGISAARDDLCRFAEWFDQYLPPIEADNHSQHLLQQYAHHRNRLNGDLGFHLGRSRLATLSTSLGERMACDHLGRCFLGCPRRSIYAPSQTLEELTAFNGFRYYADAFVTHFDITDNAVSTISSVDSNGRIRKHKADTYVLGAGTLGSSRIFLDSLYRHNGTVVQLNGLMDNPQCTLPFLSPRMLGRPVETSAYQLQLLAFGLNRGQADEYVHGQITTLKAAAIHPIVQSLPFDFRTSLRVFRFVHSALGVANVWLHDRRSENSFVSIAPEKDLVASRLKIHYEDSTDRLAEALTPVRRALKILGCVVPKGMSQQLPGGSSVHYAGTIPMQERKQPRTCSPSCRSHDFDNLYFADGVSFPFLPAKNLTFTLMANAIRVAEGLIRDVS